MPIDTTQPNSAGWWLHRLSTELEQKRPRLDRLESYYRGRPPLPVDEVTTADVYQRFLRRARANYAKLIVEAVRQKMIVKGFRTGAEGDEQSDAVAWGLWQGSQLDADSLLVHRAQLVMGDGYAIVGRDPAGQVVITPEDPRQVITAHDPIRRRKVIAALKVYSDDVENVDVAYVYLPGEVWRATRKRAVSLLRGQQSPLLPGLSGWEWDDKTPQALPAPVVPVVRFGNDPSLSGESVGEFEDFTDVLDRINHMILQRMVIATLQAFRQRAVKGVPLKDEAGAEIDYEGIFSSDPGALWLLPQTAELWESGQVDLTPILGAVREDVKELASVTQTPLYMLASDAVNQSAEGASLSREGNVAKVKDRTRNAGESWEQVMSLAFTFADDPQRAAMPDMEALWEAPESYSLTERYSAAAQAKAAGVPTETIFSEVLGFSPQQVKRALTQRADELLLLPDTNAPAGP